MIKAVLFDLDGTLMDTSEGIFHTANFTVARLGQEPCYDERQLRKFVGPPLRDCFRIVYGYSDDALLDECVSVYREEYLKVGMHLCHLYDGIADAIHALHDAGVKVGVCTLKYEKLAKLIFEEKGIANFFDTVHGTDESGKLTKADCIRLSCGDLALDTSEVLMVGDTVNDLMGAREAGTAFAAVTWGFGFEKGCTVDYGTVMDSPEEILTLVKGE